MGDIKRYRLKKPYSTIAHNYEVGDEIAFVGGKYWIGFESFTEGQLNNLREWVEEIKEEKPKEWEIVSLKYKADGNVYPFTTIPTDKFEIWSVRRLSDGEVFTIGDEVSYEPTQTHWWKIDNFFVRIADNVMLVRSKDNIGVEELSTVIKKSKPKEEVFTWTRELVEEFFWDETGFPDTRNRIDEFIKSKQSKQSSNTEERASKIPLRLTEQESNFIQATFNVTDNWYWTDFSFKKVGERSYELWSAEQLPPHIKKEVRPKTHSQADMDKAREDAFNAARERFGNNYQYLNAEYYLQTTKSKNSLKK